MATKISTSRLLPSASSTADIFYLKKIPDIYESEHSLWIFPVLQTRSVIQSMLVLHISSNNEMAFW